jgi:outer membrane receptor protein involved in Fe transport
VPNTAADQELGIRDVNDERDGFGDFSWVHTFSPEVLLTVSPFYRYNQAEYNGGSNDPLITTDNRISKYVGGQAILGVVRGKHNFSTGIYSFHQHDNRAFGLTLNDGSGVSAHESQSLGGNLISGFVEEQFKPTEWLTFNGGLRLSHYAAGITEKTTDPRIGATIKLPRLNWVLRGFWGSYYQAPPLAAISGPVLDFAVSQGFELLPLKGERDQQREFGLTIPIKSWTLNFSQFFTNAENFSDQGTPILHYPSPFRQFAHADSRSRSTRPSFSGAFICTSPTPT